MKTRTYIALLSFSIGLQARPDVQIVPAGEFAARDGRPGPGKKWSLTNEQGIKLAAKLTAAHQKTAFVFDYEHQSLHAASNGQPAPAAGWATQFEWRPGQGIFTVDAKWTDKAKLAIESDEYRYLSPVIQYDQTGAVVGVLNAAITNNPALDLQPVSAALQAALSAQFTTEHDDMNLLQMLIAALSLKAEATEQEALAALAVLQAKAAGQPVIPQPVAAALAIKADGDLSVAVTAIEALKAKAGGADTSQATIAALTTQVATLTAAVNSRELDEVIAKGLADGKLVPATEAWARGLGKTDIASLKNYLATVPAIAPTTAQTSGQKIDVASLTLTSEEIAVCSNLGLTQEAFLAQKKKDAEEKNARMSA